ncbi:N-acetyltransferase [Vibrio rhizosphaerae]|uniref:N-acetyltransferase n=1 Tax=Vibrio rhizosphaerae TaxID=398736 RepID=A0ABU4IRC5_9VIBR|nr:N-acetyltransferase [Vibrio rhizosphaerae]MDW6091952.1 N-acetyltransferase [Vibrio rhizosphaerae]
MLIRTEAPADILPIDQLLRSSLNDEDTADLVMAYRESSRITLSLVACDDEGQILGYILFTPVAHDGVFHSWQHLRLLLTAPQTQDDIKPQLVTEGLNSLYEFGYPVCTVFGVDEYYQSLGFRPGNHFGISPAAVLPSPHQLLICEMVSGTVDAMSGHPLEFDASLLSVFPGF